MLWNVYQLHDLLSSIVSNRDSQFILTMWKSLCKRLRITASLFTVYHFEINDQSKWVNQDIKRELRIYCNYMQNDWVKWISMMKFSNNSNIFSITSMIFFYFNKEFHSWISFDSDTIDYKTTCEQLKARKANDIIIQMNVMNVSEQIKASQWSSRDLTQIWLRFNSDMTQHLFSSLTSFNQLLLSSRQTHFFVLRVINRFLWQTHFFVSQTFFESTYFLCFNTFSLRLTSIWVTTI